MYISALGIIYKHVSTLYRMIEKSERKVEAYPIITSLEKFNTVHRNLAEIELDQMQVGYTKYIFRIKSI